MTSALAASALVLLIAIRWRPRPSARGSSVGAAISSAAESTAAHGVVVRRSHRWRLGAPPIEPGEVAVWCEALARMARGGTSLASSLRDVDPPAACRGVVDEVTLALQRGRGLTDALRVRHASPHLGLALGVLRACAINGGPPAEPLDRAAATLRRRAIADADRRTQSAQARLSAVVMTVLPLAMLGLLLAASSTTRHAVATPVGAGAVGAGAALNGIGWCWMRRIIGGGRS